MKRNHTLFVFTTFGFWAGMHYLWDRFVIRFRKFLGTTRWLEQEPSRFEDLSDEAAEKCALSFGIYDWQSRAHLNQIWNNFKDTLN